MNIFGNLGWFFVGSVITAIGVLGFLIFYSNPKSETHRSFLFFSLVTMFWSFFNYLNSQISLPEIALWSVRITILLATWHAFSFLRLCYVLPKEHISFPKWYRHVLVPGVLMVSLFALTPFFFSLSDQVLIPDRSPIIRGPAIFLFVLLLFVLIPGGLFYLLKKMFNSVEEAKKQFQIILWGSIGTFLLLIIFNFVLPTFYGNTFFIPFGALFMLPFILSTAYAITSHHLLDIKILRTEFFVFVLVVITLFQIVLSKGFLALATGLSVFILVLVFGISLIRSARGEAILRENLEKISGELAVSNQNLRELNERKSDFVSIASHQIRAPITAIKGYASMLSEGSFGHLPQRTVEPVARILRSAENLVSIVEDFLNLSRIERGKLSYQFAPLDISKIAHQVAAEFKSRAEEKGLLFSFSTEKGGKYIATADEEKIRQIFSNLLDNAIKYTPSGKITARLAHNEKGTILFSVIDTGSGILPADMPRLFERFNRGSQGGGRKLFTDGTGIGLFIAKEMVEAHHGRIWAESLGAGKGATFFLELPTVR